MRPLWILGLEVLNTELWVASAGTEETQVQQNLQERPGVNSDDLPSLPGCPLRGHPSHDFSVFQVSLFYL